VLSTPAAPLCMPGPSQPGYTTHSAGPGGPGHRTADKLPVRTPSQAAGSPGPGQPPPARRRSSVAADLHGAPQPYPRLSHALTRFSWNPSQYAPRVHGLCRTAPGPKSTRRGHRTRRPGACARTVTRARSGPPSGAHTFAHASKASSLAGRSDSKAGLDCPEPRINRFTRRRPLEFLI
jgi:hypothetical protein